MIRHLLARLLRPHRAVARAEMVARIEGSRFSSLLRVSLPASRKDRDRVMDAFRAARGLDLPDDVRASKRTTNEGS